MSFKDTFDPNTDLIYGIGAWISRYIINYDSGGKKKYQKKDKISQGEWDAAHRRKEEDCFAINTFNMAITNAQYALNTGTISVSNVGDSAYMDEIQQTKYGTGSTIGNASGLEAKLRKGNRNLSMGSPGEVCAAAKDLAIRRSSKFGIKYAVANLRGTVHYILDEIEPSVLLAKSTITNTSGYEKIPICTSEIRYLFRNWKRYGGSGKVVFWENYAVTAAPWASAVMQHKVGWAEYALHRMWKYRTKVQGVASLQKFGTAKQKDFNQLIANVQKFLENNLQKQQNASNFIKGWFGEDVTTPNDIIRVFHTLDGNLVNEDSEPI
jgi:hypothetical protein